MLKPIGRRLPARVQHSLRTAAHPSAALTRRRHIKRLLSTRSAEPSRTELKELREKWGGGGTAGVVLLQEVVRRAQQASAPILECGSGLSTVLLAIYAGERGVPVFSLEEDLYWVKRVEATLSWYGLEGAQVVYSPITDYGDLKWYSIPEGLPSYFEFVLCDGPVAHGVEEGRRYGLVPLMGERLSGSTILLDDISRAGERDIARGWLEEYDCQVEEEVEDRYAVISVP